MTLDNSEFVNESSRGFDFEGESITPFEITTPFFVITFAVLVFVIAEILDWLLFARLHSKRDPR